MTARSALAAGVAIALVAAGVVAAYRSDGERSPSVAVRSFVEPVSERVATRSDRTRVAPKGQRSRQAIDVRGTEDGTEESEQPLEAARAAPRRLVVRFRGDVAEAAKERVRSLVNARLLRPLPIAGAELVGLPEDVSVEVAREQLSSRPEVAYAEPDFIYRASAVLPNDPRFSSLWGLHAAANTDIDAPEAWSAVTGASSVRVGVVDTGVAYDHPDLAPNIWINPGEVAANGIDDDGNGYVDDVRGWDWIGRDNDPLDLQGHGTHVAGTVAAKGNNGIAVTGVSWGATIVPLRVLDANGSGTSSGIASAFSYAGKLGIEVVNASLGGPWFSQAVLDSIRSSPGTLFVVAAGNEAADNDSVASYPCNYDLVNILCVAATTQTGALAGFSNYGASTVDIGAPGSGIVSTLPKTETRFSEGFESGFAERWSPTGAGSAWGVSSDGHGSYLSDSPSGTYAPAADTAISFNDRLDLNAARGCRLRYALRLDTEKGRDLLVVEGSKDGVAWSRLGTMSGSTQGGWTEVSLDLGSFDGDGLHLRFRLTSDDNATVGGGADIDDIEVRCIGTSYTGSEVGTYSGTSMAAPHAAGAAAVLKSADAGLDASSLKRALIGGALSTPALEGRTVTGGRLNLARSLALVAPLPLDEPAPAPSPSPAPSFTQSEQLDPVTETPTPTPSGGDPLAPAPGSSPVPTPTPTAGGESTPAPSQGVVDRTVHLDVTKHLVARGTVASSQPACRSGAKVVIKRNGARAAVARTNAAGSFRTRLPDRIGRYAAVAVAGGDCPRAVARARHRHASGIAGGADQGEVTVAAAGGTCWTYARAERRLNDLLAGSRERAGLDPLRLDSELSRVARLHALEMARSGSVFHTPSALLQARVIGWNELGENIGLGSGPVALHESFMASPAHRENILDDGFSNAGVGVVRDERRVWVTVLFQGGEDPDTTLRMPSC